MLILSFIIQHSKKLTLLMPMHTTKLIQLPSFSNLTRLSWKAFWSILNLYAMCLKVTLSQMSVLRQTILTHQRSDSKNWSKFLIQVFGVPVRRLISSMSLFWGVVMEEFQCMIRKPSECLTLPKESRCLSAACYIFLNTLCF